MTVPVYWPTASEPAVHRNLHIGRGVAPEAGLAPSRTDAVLGRTGDSVKFRGQRDCRQRRCVSAAGARSLPANRVKAGESWSGRSESRDPALRCTLMVARTATPAPGRRRRPTVPAVRAVPGASALDPVDGKR